MREEARTTEFCKKTMLLTAGLTEREKGLAERGRREGSKQTGGRLQPTAGDRAADLTASVTP